MIKKDLCLSVRDQVGAESMGCIDPYPDEHGNYRVRKWVTYQGTVIHCGFFERHLGWRFYIANRDIFFITNKEDQVILRWHDGCGIRIYDFVRELYRSNIDEITMLFIHSCFCRMARAAAEAARAAYEAGAAARDAAHAAAAIAAAHDALAAAYAARAAYAEAARRAFRKMIILRKEVAKLK